MDVADERADAADALLRELERGGARTAETLLVLECLITKHLLGIDLGIADRIDELSSWARELGPDLATLRGTRGAVLLELGRYDEGKAMLTPLVEGPVSYDAALSRLFLAQAEHERGDAMEARRLLEAADAAFRACPYPGAVPLLARTRRRIETAAARSGDGASEP